jgi:predicted nucleic acid-binding protein
LIEGGLVGVQVLNDFVAVARRNMGMTWPEIIEALSAIRVLCPASVPLTIGIHEAALGVAERHGYHIYDSLVIAAAQEASGRTLYSDRSPRRSRDTRPYPPESVLNGAGHNAGRYFFPLGSMV